MADYIQPLKYPNSDNLMTYDYLRHRYYLTEDAIYTYLGINFGTLPPNGLDANPSDLARRWVTRVSDLVYRYITKDSPNPDRIAFEMATVAGLRTVVLDMLLDQAAYMAETGDIGTLSGIDAFKGKMANREDISAARISYGVEDIAYTVQPCLGGRCLKYVGLDLAAYPVPPYTDEDGNKVW